MHREGQRPVLCFVFRAARCAERILKDTLNAVRPTVFFGVRRVWEKFAEALVPWAAKTTGARKKISTWAKRVALRH